jgi:transposase
MVCLHLEGGSAMKIVAIDLGQSKSVFCEFDTTTGEYGFSRLITTAERIHTLLQRERPDQVVVEICPLAATVHDVATELGLDVIVADTTQDAWRWKNNKRKTDRDDALKLARLGALGQLNPVHIPSPRMRQWRRAVEHRQTLVAEVTRCKNRIRSLLLPQGHRLPRGKSGWALKVVERLCTLAQPLSACGAEELWRGLLHVELRRLEALLRLRGELDAKLDELVRGDARTRRLVTIPGVGPRTAEVLVAVLDDARRFHSRRQVAAYAGLTPRRYQSGQIDRQGRISKRGSPLLRQVLNQAAWAAVRCNPHLRQVFLRISGRRKGRRKPAIVAVMRRLLVTAWALLRDETVYQPRPPARSAA